MLFDNIDWDKALVKIHKEKTQKRTVNYAVYSGDERSIIPEPQVVRCEEIVSKLSCRECGGKMKLGAVSLSDFLPLSASASCVDCGKTINLSQLGFHEL